MESLYPNVILSKRLKLLVDLGSACWNSFLRCQSAAILEIPPIGLSSILQVPPHQAQLLGLGLHLHSQALERKVLRGPAVPRIRWPSAWVWGSDHCQTVQWRSGAVGLCGTFASEEATAPWVISVKQNSLRSQETWVTNGSNVKGGKEICILVGCASVGWIKAA